MKESYTPVPWDFREVLEEEKQKHTCSTIHYFDNNDEIASVAGNIREIVEIPGEGEFLKLGGGEMVRLDTIITLYGKPGPAFEKYDAYANACLSCTGGYDL